jgi:transposase InsO family protein
MLCSRSLNSKRNRKFRILTRYQWLASELVRLLPKAECLGGEISYNLREAQVVIENWRIHYNTRRPHSALGYRPPAPVTIAPQPSTLDGAANMQ